MCVSEQVSLPARDLTKWTDDQKKSFRAVAGRYREESAAYYSLLAIGLVGSVKLEQFKASLPRDATSVGSGVAL